MSRTIFTGALLAGLALSGVIASPAFVSPASAADLPRPAPVTKAPVYTPAPIYNWTGLYLGLNGGYGWGRSNWDTVGGFDLSGGLVGGTIGYNWQMGNIVYGLEGDLDWSNIKGDAAGVETRNSWLSTVRGRIGYAFDRFMPYVTGGLALGDIKASAPGLPGDSATRAGWTVGGGVEYGITQNLSVKAEYLYADLGSFDCGAACSVGGTNDVSFHTNIVRAGINFRF